MKLVALAAALALPCAVAHAAGLGENIERKAWTLTDEAKALLKRWKAEGAAYSPRSDHIGLFARGQLKYGADRSDFIHNWYERPLHQNTAWQEASRRDVLINPLAWKKTAETVRLGKMDGLAACPTQSGRQWIIPRSVEPGGEMTVFLELPYGYHEGDIDKYLKVAEMASEMPNVYKIDGRIVLTRYPAVREPELEKAERFRKALDDRFGPDKFIVMYYVHAFEGGLPDGPMTVEALEKAREHLRRVLRKTDGIFYAGWDVYWPRRYNLAFERDVIVPMFHAVLCEPEFKGRKYLGMPMCQGHANCYRWCYSLDSNATQCFVDRMKAMEALRPDFILACEWDEENENTHFRPTVSCGYTNMRIMRYWADRFAGREPSAWPLDDDRSVANLVVSYRKSLVVGEPIETEVLNIPDGSFKDSEFTVSLKWLNAAGKAVKAYPAQKLSARELAAVRFVSPASELAGERAVIPELTVEASKGGRFRFSDGLWPLDIHATRQVDAWWIKTPLREVPKGVSGALRCGKADETGAYLVSGSVKSPVEVKSVEVLAGPDTVFMVDPEKPVRTGTERFVIDIQGLPAAASEYKMNGTITVERAPGAKMSKPWRYITLDGNVWTFKDAAIWSWPWVLSVEMPSAEVENASLAINLPGCFKGRVKLRSVMSKDVVGISGPGGGSLTIRRALEQPSIPKHLDAKSSAFEFKFKPIDDNCVLRLQVIDKNDRVWRSAPYQFFRRKTGKTVAFTVFERDEERVHRVALDESLVPAEIAYDFSPTRGSVVAANGLGRAYWGILGGYVPQVNGIGRGESDYGNALAIHINTSVPDWQDSAPTYVAEDDGSYSVHFKGAEYGTFPQQLVSMYSGWEVEMDVFPESAEGNQALFGCSGVGSNIYLDKGVPTVYYFSACDYARQSGSVKKATGPALSVGQWNKLRVTFDQKSLQVETNGRRGDPRPFSGYMHQQRYTSMGGENHSLWFFRGKMKNLRIRVK